VVRSRALAEYLAEIFLADLKHGQRFVAEAEEPLRVRLPRAGGGRSYEDSLSVAVVVAPENAVEATLELLRSANRSLYIEQFYIYTYWGRAKEDSPETAPNLFLEEAISAARRGVEVKVLLDSTWYNVKRDDPRSNLRTVRYVNEIARRENLPLEARLARRDDKITKYHLKGVVVDGKVVLLGSMNWNEHSPKKNREVNVIIYGPPASYFERLFLEDWERSGDKERGSRGVAFIVIALIITALAIKKLVRKL
jgi:phosphatidylserine/phosphatidylglycerophosphate/cardiolipin synthase-like enzyme